MAKTASKSVHVPANVSDVSMLENGNITHVQWGLIAFDHDIINRVVRRKRRPTTESDKLRNILAREGWQTQKGIICVFDKKSPLCKNNPEYQGILDRNYAKRLELKSKLEASENAADKLELEVFKMMYCDNEGMVIRPMLIAATCNGRGEVYYDSQVLRYKGEVPVEPGENKEKPQTPIVNVPIEYCIFDNEKSKIDKQVDENSKEVGNFQMTTKDKLRVVVHLMRKEGITQTEARNKFPGTTGQKAWLFAKLDQLWSKNCTDLFPGEKQRPDLALAERALDLSVKDDNYVSFSSMNNIPPLTEAVNRSTPQGLLKLRKQIESDNEKIDKQEKVGEKRRIPSPMTADEVQEMVAREGKKGGNPKTNENLKKEVWQNYKNNECELVRQFANAQLGATTEPIAEIIENTEVWNQTMECLRKYGKAAVLMALNVLSHPQFNKFAELILSGKTIEIREVVAEDNGTLVSKTD